MPRRLSQVLVLMMFGISGVVSLGCSKQAPTAANKPAENDVIKIPNGMPGSQNPKAKGTQGKLGPSMTPGYAGNR